MSHQQPNNIDDKFSRGHETPRTIYEIIHIVLGQVDNLQSTDDHIVTMEKKSLSLHSRKISLWTKEKSDAIWEAVRPVMAAEFQMNETDLKLPVDFEDQEYLRPGKKIDNILLSPKPQELTVAVHSLVLWSTISLMNKHFVIAFLRILKNQVPKFDDAYLGWRYIWHIYKCTSCLGCLAFSRVVHTARDDTKGIEMYFLGRMLDITGSFFISHMRSGMTHKPFRPTVIFKEGVISKDLLHFITTSLLCTVDLDWDLLHDGTDEDTNENILQAISNEVNWNGKFESASFTMSYFYDFLSKFHRSPNLMEEKIQKALVKAKEGQGLKEITNKLRREHDLYDRTVSLNRHKAVTAHVEELDLQENDVSMIDKPFKTNKYVDDEAEEANEEANFENCQELLGEEEQPSGYTSGKKKGEDKEDDQTTPPTKNPPTESTGTKKKRKSGDKAEELAANNNTGRKKTKKRSGEKAEELTANNNTGRKKTKKSSGEKVEELTANNNTSRKKTKKSSGEKVEELAANSNTGKKKRAVADEHAATITTSLPKSNPGLKSGDASPERSNNDGISLKEILPAKQGPTNQTGILSWVFCGVLPPITVHLQHHQKNLNLQNNIMNKHKDGLPILGNHHQKV
jgi:hypothetical protein